MIYLLRSRECAVLVIAVVSSASSSYNISNETKDLATYKR